MSTATAITHALVPLRRLSRRPFWRSPDGQPRWARPALLGIAATAAFLYTWNIAHTGYAQFYSVAVKSMSVSWKALLYGALDPGASITIDKLAGAFVPQAISARVLGFHPWSLALPQVIEGVIAVLVMYRVVRRWAGPAAGLIAAGLFTLTPVAASMFGHPMEDGLLTMCLVLAADSFQRAVTEARLRSLMMAGLWIGAGFQAKMLEAWVVLPAMALTYLIAAPAPVRRRLGQLSAAGLVLLAASLSWVVLYTLTPAGDRPYVDGSTNNSAFAMVFGYNGLDRLGIHVPGAMHSIVGGAPAAPGGGTGAAQGWLKLFTGTYGTQIGWLYPLALLALALGLSRRRALRVPGRAGFLLWGLWLLSYGVLYSRMLLPHTAYVASLAPPLAALSAAGLVMVWQGYRDGSARWALPTAVAAETAWAVWLSQRYQTFLPWLTWIIAAAGILSAAALTVGRRARPPRQVVGHASMTLGVAAMLAAPAAWSASVLDTYYAGSALDASAGPGGGLLGMGHTGPAAGPGGLGLRGTGTLSGSGLPGPGALPDLDLPGPGGAALTESPASGTGSTLDAAQQDIDRYLIAHRNGAEFIAATDSWRTAQPYIMATGQAFMPMGGFEGSTPSPTLAQAQRLVRDGRLRYFLLTAEGSPQGITALFGGGASATSAAVAWVKTACMEVPAADYLAHAASGRSRGSAASGGVLLYVC